MFYWERVLAGDLSVVIILSIKQEMEKAEMERKWKTCCKSLSHRLVFTIQLTATKVFRSSVSFPFSYPLNPIDFH